MHYFCGLHSESVTNNGDNELAMLMRFSLKAPMEAWAQFFLIGTLLFFPMSSSAKSICLTLSLGSIIFSPGFRADFVRLFSTHWCKAAFLLFGMALIFCLWSPANSSQLQLVVEKYSKLLYLPILVVGFQNSTTRQLCFHAFLLAMLITCGLSILKFQGYLASIASTPDNIFRNHIMTSYMVAFAAYLSFLFCFRHQKYARIAYGLLALLFSYQILFINGSRTGYIIYLLLMFLLVLQICTWRQAILGIVAISSLFTTCYFISPVMKMRVDDVVRQVKGYQHNERNTDIGIRLQFHDYAHQLFNQHPILGNGTASFAYYYDKERPVDFSIWKTKTLLEPHSQYWLVAAEFGLFGIAALSYFFFSLLQASWRLHKLKFMACAMLVPFLIGNLSDSLLFYSGSGYFFILFMAMFLGEEFEYSKRDVMDGAFV